MAERSASVSHNLPQLSQAEVDAALEREIETARLAATNTKDTDLARAGFQAMADLIAQRSPQQIERMERERGLSSSHFAAATTALSR
jgi:hypothetical protein